MRTVDNHEIRKVVIATGSVTTLAGSTISGHADGVGGAASFYSPTGITTDGKYLYVADCGNNEIRRIDIASGTVYTIAGSKTSGHVDGPGLSASFLQPFGIATDGTYLYVTDMGNHEIYRDLPRNPLLRKPLGGQRLMDWGDGARGG